MLDVLSVTKAIESDIIINIIWQRKTIDIPFNSVAGHEQTIYAVIDLLFCSITELKG